MKITKATTFTILLLMTMSACATIRNYRNEIIEKRQVENVCKGIGISNATEYPSTLDIHPIYLVNNDGKNWNDQLPVDWRYEYIKELELVGCAEQMMRKKIEVCKNILGSYEKRYEYEMKFRLVKAKTGDLITSYTFHDEQPPQCNPEGFSPDRELAGPEIIFRDQMENWLRQFVEY